MIDAQRPVQRRRREVFFQFRIEVVLDGHRIILLSCSRWDCSSSYLDSASVPPTVDNPSWLADTVDRVDRVDTQHSNRPVRARVVVIAYPYVHSVHSVKIIVYQAHSLDRVDRVDR